MSTDADSASCRAGASPRYLAVDNRLANWCAAVAHFFAKEDAGAFACIIDISQNRRSTSSAMNGTRGGATALRQSARTTSVPGCGGGCKHIPQMMAANVHQHESRQLQHRHLTFLAANSKSALWTLACCSAPGACCFSTEFASQVRAGNSVRLLQKCARQAINQS